MNDIIKAQNGNVLAYNAPKLTEAAPAAPAKLDAMSALKLYAQYTKLKAQGGPQDAEWQYRNKIQQAFQRYNGKQITNYFSDPQKQNIDQLKARGIDPNFCISGSCTILRDAGDTFKGNGNIDGIYFGNETAQQDLKGDGFTNVQDPDSFKRGDILQLMMNKDGRNIPDHAMLFDSYIKDENGKTVGIRTFQNHGDGNERYADMIDDPKYHSKGNDITDLKYSDVMQNWNPQQPLQQGKFGLQAWTKSPESFQEQNQKAYQDYSSQLNNIKQQLINYDPRMKDDSYTQGVFNTLNSNLPKPQQFKLYAEGGIIADDVVVEVGSRTYKVKVAKTDDEREKGLQGVKELSEDEGMLFIFDEPTEVGFWMKDTLIPLDIIFINEDQEVVEVNHGQPQNTDEVFQGENIKYVLEVNLGSGVKVGDDVEIESLEEENEENRMHVLDENGETQMELKGGERIFSRPNTKTLIRLAKRAYRSESDKDYKALGRKLFQYLHTQNTKDDDYVELPSE